MQLSASLLNTRYLEHAVELLSAYNDLFKRAQKMNPWIMITLHETKAVDNLFMYTNFFLQEF